MFYSVISYEDKPNKVEEYPSKGFLGWGKIRFKSHDITLLSL